MNLKNRYYARAYMDPGHIKISWIGPVFGDKWTLKTAQMNYGAFSFVEHSPISVMTRDEYRAALIAAGCLDAPRFAA